MSGTEEDIIINIPRDSQFLLFMVVLFYKVTMNTELMNSEPLHLRK